MFRVLKIMAWRQFGMVRFGVPIHAQEAKQQPLKHVNLRRDFFRKAYT